MQTRLRGANSNSEYWSYLCDWQIENEIEMQQQSILIRQPVDCLLEIEAGSQVMVGAMTVGWIFKSEH
jgi:hypothetical protein